MNFYCCGFVFININISTEELYYMAFNGCEFLIIGLKEIYGQSPSKC